LTPETLDLIAVPEEDSIEVVTLADRLHAIGDVPTQRILTTSRLPTVNDVVRLADGEPKHLCELVDGFLVEKAMGWRESFIGAELLTMLGAFVREQRHRPGMIAGEQVMTELSPGQVRMPDVAFYSWARFPNGVPDESAPAVAPDLAVEVLSPGNTPGEMERKRKDYFAAGVRLYWEVDIRTRTVDVYTSPAKPNRLDQNATLTGGDVLPGFEVKLADLFRILDEPAKNS
jgi:Uma2 family endonuclease